MTKIDPLLQPLITHLRSEGRPRVWSIIVTILGEIGVPRGEALETSELLEMCQKLGIEGSAVRTAMSRLSKDGLIESIKVGRKSQYRFSVAGQVAYEGAANFIYAKPQHIADWVSLTPEPGMRGQAVRTVIETCHPLCLANGALIVPKDTAQSLPLELQNSCIALDFQNLTLPPWAVANLGPVINSDACNVLIKVCSQDYGASISCVSARALRVLAIHLWRRLVLRYPIIQAPIPDRDWPLGQVHEILASAYPRWVAKSGEGEKASKTLGKRFKSSAQLGRLG